MRFTPEEVDQLLTTPAIVKLVERVQRAQHQLDRAKLALHEKLRAAGVDTVTADRIVRDT